MFGLDDMFSMRDQSQHSARRKMQSHPYSQQAVLQNQSLIGTKADVLVRCIIQSCERSADGRTADVFRLCGLFSLEVILKIAFTRDCGDEATGYSEVMLKAMDASALALYMGAAIPALKKYERRLPGGIGHLYRQFDLWVEMTTSLVNNFRAQEISLDKTHRFIATPLLTARDDFLGRQLKDDEIVEEAMAIAFAGSGTTSTTLVYLLYQLASNPNVQVALRQELLRAPNQDLSTIQDLPFVNAVMKETMRLHPTIISTLPRILGQPLQAGEMMLPAGTVVGMQNFIHHRDPTIFADPKSFHPHRWLHATKDMHAALTPFSVGPRNCVGQNLAMAELYLA